MGRPSASAENKVIAIEFAKAVTRKTSDPKDLLARCGRCSLFSVFQEMFPQIVRDGTSSARHGLTEVEFNKLLQVLENLTTALPLHLLTEFPYRPMDSTEYATVMPPIDPQTRSALGSTYSVESAGLILTT